MKITGHELLIARGKYAASEEWMTTKESLFKAISEVEWPPGSGTFTIYPEQGKKRGEGNGVTPIKFGLIKELSRQGWLPEQPLDIATVTRPGKLDAVLSTSFGPVAIEWETGNISSSHRALNKMCLGLLHEVLVCGILVVPTRRLAQYLTDRVGNLEELLPYLDLWRSIPIKDGILMLVAIEHDAESWEVPRIPKGTDGRAIY